MNFDLIKRRMAVKSALQLFALIVIATIVRPLLVEQDAIFTYIGMSNAVLAGITYLVLSRTKPKSWHPYLLIVAGFAALLPLVFTSGGINSQFIYILPMIPIFCALIATVRAAIIVTIFSILLILYLAIFGTPITDFTFENVDESKTHARAVWLVLSCLLGLSFGSEFEFVNRKLSLKLFEQAFKDELTGISNRRSILEYLQVHLEEAGANFAWLTVMMVDLDYFKQLNDSHGHAAGDTCLIAVSSCLQSSIRQGQDEVGRYGGEEFLLVLPGLEPSKAKEVGEKLRQKISAISLPDINISPTATLGFVSVKVTADTAMNDLLNKADSALYEGKKAGRNCVKQCVL